MGVKKEVYQARLKQGLCPKCGGKRDRETKACSACAKLHNERTKRSKEKRWTRGLCQDCPNKRCPDSPRCIKCKSKVNRSTKALTAKRKAKNKCRWCGGPRLKGCKARTCAFCYFKSASLRCSGDFSLEHDLRNLFFGQNAKCAYTGIEIKLGQNASVDHKTPPTRGGSKIDPENLHWVDLRINWMKRDLTHYEFLSLCKKVTERFR